MHHQNSSFFSLFSSLSLLVIKILISPRISKKKREDKKYHASSEKREKRTHDKTLDKEREGKEKNDGDIRCNNNQYSYEYYY